jgi:hypothetical protein
MKTTIEISDDLIRKAKALAARRRMTLESVIERGLRNMIAEEERAQTYRLPDESVSGKRLQPGLAEEDWADIRYAAYERPGG